MEIKQGSWANISPNYVSFRNDYPTIALQNKYPVFVYFINFALVNGERVRKSEVGCMMKDIMGNKYNGNSFVIREEFLIPISDEEAKKQIKIANKPYYNQLKIDLKSISPKHIGIKDRKGDYYQTGTKNFLKTSNSFVKLVGKNTINNTSTQEAKYNAQRYFGVECCSFTKTSTQDLLVYIPKTWLNYYGYNLTDLKSYLRFLEKCEIGFSSEILGIVDLHNAFKQTKVERILKAGNFYYKKDELAYEVLIKSGDKAYITYLYFLLVRYIFNKNYWNIPFIAMKLKKNIPKASYWQCLLLAHNNDIYNRYFSLVGRPRTSYVYNKNKDPLNTKERVLNLLRQGNSGVNASFQLRNSALDITEAIRTENYTALQEFLNEN